MIVTLGQQYNIGEKPTVILYRDTRKTAKTKKYIIKHGSNNILLYMGCEDEVTTLKREQRGQ